ncbi:MAG: hypothetical protein CMK83_13810 [Pseudomonadales bacterium]|jgi:DNA-directed RNA polymerase subunit RPC12/RpoP|uniref:hypothetical protein n=1 Tax=unclassified Ketobacter TaxID=2639109 RepID=UPI000C6BF3E9|nr:MULTISPECIES: hypothetical protein [unclassified Ketobacter]MAQ25279.1 hypothetical protein [Pseudomonadales bacterium]MEC8811280.1 hypothetical protein [Pseudomonadota bacterium]TNC89502.1 MAG: hypothetical protein CSH49_06975 [Alcanivorax sp.]HAG94843.1 hypothetical protein [Gammaproteobacteria bacterium]MBI26003.1 hypothetical protein [Pseudomonadales bacterium]|tara:strand:- start:887 stop:1069 length:183 start_codon:yes stop_codon:yes gene_type:complete
MQAELTLNLKCPSCGSLTPKSLSEIKAQRAFDCECGFHADLQPQVARPEVKARKKRALPA